MNWRRSAARRWTFWRKRCYHWNLRGESRPCPANVMSPTTKKSTKAKKKSIAVPVIETAVPKAKTAASKKRAGRSLVIVESPTKQKTIARFLGSGYTIMATYGHIRDLPSRSIGVDEANNFEPQYVILPKAKKVIPGLKEAVKNADKVYLATDF